MPTRELRAYAKAMEPLAAERSLAEAERIAVGTATMRSGSRDAAIRRWQSALRSSAARRPATPAEMAASARASGIGFRRTVRAKPSGS